MLEVAVRLQPPAIVSLVLAGAAAFACATPATEGDEPELPLPERVSSAPNTDGAVAEASAPPRDASLEREAAPVDAFRQLHAFVSSTIFDGNFGGVAGADLKCNTLAAAQGLKGKYRAWVSVSGTNAADRITSAGPWHLVTGPLVAATHAELVSGKLARPLDIDEKGTAAPTDEDRVWTGTAADGTFSGPECGQWAGGGSGRVGEAEFSDTRWSNATTEACDQVNRVYCFEL
jgi:hypothetical protein